MLNLDFHLFQPFEFKRVVVVYSWDILIGYDSFILEAILNIK